MATWTVYSQKRQKIAELSSLEDLERAKIPGDQKVYLHGFESEIKPWRQLKTKLSALLKGSGPLQSLEGAPSADSQSDNDPDTRNDRAPVASVRVPATRSATMLNLDGAHTGLPSDLGHPTNNNRGNNGELSEQVRMLDAALAHLCAVLKDRISQLHINYDNQIRATDGLKSSQDQLAQDLATTQTELQQLSRASIEKTVAEVTHSIVDPIIHQLEKLLKHSEDERAHVEVLVDEHLDLVKRYNPGRVTALEQELAQLKLLREGTQEELRKKDQSIDEAERMVAHLRSQTGALDREQLERLREEIARERNELESVQRLTLERDQFKAQVTEFKVLEERYRQHQDAHQADLELGERAAKLETERDELLAEIKKRDLKIARLEVAQRLEQEISQSHVARLNQQSQNLTEQTRKRLALESENQVLTQARDEWENERSDFRASADGLRNFEAELIRRQREIETEREKRQREIETERESELTVLNDRFARRIEDMGRFYREQAYENTRSDLDRLDRELADSNQKREELAVQAEELRRQCADAQAAELEWHNSRSQHLAELQSLDIRLQATQRDHDGLLTRFDNLEMGYQDLQSRHAARVGELERDYGDRAARQDRQLHEVQQRIQHEEAALEHTKKWHEAEMQRLEQRRSEVRTEIAQFEQRKRELEAHTGREARLEIINQGYFEDNDVTPHDFKAPISESQWLAEVATGIKSAGFIFPQRLLEAFHTSLKISTWAPLTVLAGVSGTGKSELPRLYSHFGGLRFLSVPVQPNWDSPQDLFGFFNHMEGRYKATDLLLAIVQSQKPPKERGFNNGLLLVLLDEMNLARVELYFSEMLSRLEGRRGTGSGSAVPEVKMSLDLGAGVKPERVTLGNNLLFVGTMNEDETTHTLSDKVLDRGNVITFPRPRYLYGRSQAPIASSRGKLDFETWRGWVVEPDDKEKGLEQGVRDDLNAALNSINLALAAVNRAIGHRVLQAIQNYVANHPRTRENWKLAFEDQLVQKVMPKLRGIELESVSGKSCLDGVDQVLKRFGAGLIEDFTRARTSDYGAFLWSSASYLEQEAART